MTALPHLRPRVVLLLGALTLLPTSAPGQQPEVDAKAAFLYNLALFVDWPPEALAPGQTFVIGVIGGHPILASLEKFGGRLVNRSVVEIRRLSVQDDHHQSHILFVPRSAEGAVTALLDRLRGQPVLTVGEDERFIAWGGMLRLRVVQSRLRFHVNLTRTDAGKLHISPRLLARGQVERSADDDP